MPITANWSYPTAVKLGAGRIRNWPTIARRSA